MIRKLNEWVFDTGLLPLGSGPSMLQQVYDEELINKQVDMMTERLAVFIEDLDPSARGPILKRIVDRLVMGEGSEGNCSSCGKPTAKAQLAENHGKCNGCRNGRKGMNV